AEAGSRALQFLGMVGAGGIRQNLRQAERAVRAWLGALPAQGAATTDGCCRAGEGQSARRSGPSTCPGEEGSKGRSSESTRSIPMTRRREPSLTPLERQLLKALKAAKDHLDYCGYGDNWERQCAQAAKLEQTIDAAIEAAGERA